MDIKNPADRGRWLGNPAQLYGIEKMTAAEGFDKGSAYYFVNNGAGLSYRLSADCALDIAATVLPMPFPILRAILSTPFPPA